MIVETINNSMLVYRPEDHGMIDGYYRYCITLLRNCLFRNSFNLNVILGNYNFGFANTNKTVRIGIQCEHTLVKPGGRTVQEVIYGTVKHEDGTYLIRIQEFDYINSLDCIIEYSLANIHNISTNDRFKDYLKKVAYVSAAYYDINFDKTEKTDIITTFVDNSNSRRNKILNDLVDVNVPNKKIENCFSSIELNNVYKKTKIMVNVHQTEHHHTFEEFRVLPALMTGVLVVSEKVPLTEIIPYSNFIIWSDYKDIAKTTLDVMNNYDEYYNKIFTNGNLSNVLMELKKRDETAFDNILTNI